MVGHTRATVKELNQRVLLHNFALPYIIHSGPSISIDAVKELISYSHHGAIDPVEGAVWRVERDGQVDFLAKWVRPEKVDGKYFPEQGWPEEVWNWKP